MANDLQKKIRLILSQVKPDSKIYLEAELGMALARYRRAQKARDEGNALPPEEDAETREKKASTVINEQVRLLKILYGQRVQEADEFVKILGDEVDEVNAAVIIHTLIELGRLDAVLGGIGWRKRRNADVRRALWRAVREKLRREPHQFSDADLDAIDAKRVTESPRIPKFGQEDTFIP
jgi:hypothetical protein